MNIFKLIYNSFIWGLLAAILAFQNVWLEMRMNIGFLIPIVMVVTIILLILMKKMHLLSLKFTYINLAICMIVSVFILGLKRIQIIPSSIIREGLGVSHISFSIMNTILILIIVVGLFIVYLADRKAVGTEVPDFKRGIDMKKILKGNGGKLIALLIAVVLYFIPVVNKNVNQAISMLKNVDVDLAREYILGFGIWAPVVSFLLMVLQSIAAPLPAFIITFANAGLFGWAKGAMLSWSSAMVGAALCFFIAKYLGRDVVAKLTSRTAIEKVDEFFEKYGKYAVLIARLLPFISFDIVSYAAGLTSMSFWSFFIATGIGQLPATIVYSYIGGMLTGTTKTFVMGLLILFAVSALAVLLKKVWNDRNKSKKEGAKA